MSVDSIIASIESALDLIAVDAGKSLAFSPGANRRDYICKAPGCARNGYAGGYCNAHYMRSRDGRDMSKPLQRRGRKTSCLDCGDLVGGHGGLGRCAKHYKAVRYTAIKGALVAALGGACKRCAGVFPLAVYDFHHRGDKQFGVAQMILNATPSEIAHEAAKCDLLCANCHRIEHTHER